MVGIILAAGSGRRLKINKPKGLLNIGNKTLIEYSLNNLKKAGIDIVYIVTGFGHEQYEEFFKKQVSSQHVRLLYNPEWAACGSGYSLQLVLEELGGVEDVVILDSDILYNAEEFINFIQREEANAILATNVPEGRHDACYIQTDIGNNLVKISKNLNELTVKDDDITWEYIGITKCSAKSVKESVKYFRDLTKATSSIDHEYDYAFQTLSSKFKIIKYKDYIWSEADDNEQLHFMITNVYPKISLY